MPQVLTFDELEEVRKEVLSEELEPDIIGYINILVRDLQVCIREKERSEVKPPALCEGCHFIRDVCSMVKEPLSERATIALTHLAKAAKWLYGKCEMDDLFSMALWILPHRITLVRTRNLLDDLQGLLERERIKMEDRNVRRQWALLNNLMEKFNPTLYRLARDAALEDVVFAEELIKLEEKWVKEGILRRDELLSTQMGWKVPKVWSLKTT
ncbi:MAG TPA: hypothetical protein ENF42_03100 [Candidatus Bathyarchaeota archaeon]|nr:hypothetical protein [Candidatus Bathyarchaeota archaeon]